MRGLELRTAYAKAQVQKIIDYQVYEDIITDVLIEAQALGVHEFGRGEDHPPMLFSDVSMLVEAWMNGWEFSGNLEEMRHCANCNDGTGNPCRTHG